MKNGKELSYLLFLDEERKESQNCLWKCLLVMSKELSLAVFVWPRFLEKQSSLQ